MSKAFFSNEFVIKKFKCVFTKLTLRNGNISSDIFCRWLKDRYVSRLRESEGSSGVVSIFYG